MKYPVFVMLLLSMANAANGDWQQLQSYPVPSSEKILFHNGLFYSCSINAGVFKSSDGGLSWFEINTNLNNDDSKKVRDIMRVDDKLYIATVDGIYMSSDNGNNWNRRSTGLSIGPGANNVFAFSVYESDGVLYTGTWNGIYFSADMGENWSVSNVSGDGILAVAFIRHGNILYAGRDANNNPPLYASTDSGLNWMNMNVWNNFPISVLSFYSEGDTLFAGTGHGMWFTSNNGANWYARSDGLSPDPYLSSIIKSGNTMLCALEFGGSGIFKTSNNGILWDDISDGLPPLGRISQIVIHGDKIYAATTDKIWFRYIDEIITSAEQTTSTFPETFELFQNYPNPFNPLTVISYNLNKRSNVTLKVYDISGQELRVLTSGLQEPGSYRFNFEGASLATGVYIYKLEAGSFSQTRKMVYIK